VERIINSHIHKSTGIAPVEMVFAGQVNLNEGRLFPHRESPPELPLSEYMQQWTEYQKILLDITEKNQKQTDMFHYSKDKTGLITTFANTSLVSVAYENDDHEPPTNFITDVVDRSA
jgi:hypothetical protein